ncbi:hypothetical protein L291_0889 [Acinetobacter guillouiae MSP4-18]|nr:hypothetical protein L291_0889 [Acinetobacter guillouiae MSP4-18]
MMALRDDENHPFFIVHKLSWYTAFLKVHAFIKIANIG